MATDIQEAIEPDIFNIYTKFSIVRNPFDRMVSWYSMFKHGFGKDDRMMKVENKAKSVGLYYRGLRTGRSMVALQEFAPNMMQVLLTKPV